MIKNFLSLHDFSVYQFSKILDLIHYVKNHPKHFKKSLENKTLAMIFQKPSFQTRISLELAMQQLGCKANYLGSLDIQNFNGEIPYDARKNLENMVDGIIVKSFPHKNVTAFAKACTLPVFNSSTDLFYPCRALADIFTLKEKNLSLSNITIACIGYGNNVCHSLLFASAKAGIKVVLATPPGYEPSPEVVHQAEEDGKETEFSLCITTDPLEAVKRADVLYFTGIYQEKQKEIEEEISSSYRLSSDLLAKSRPNTLIMNEGATCLEKNFSLKAMDPSQLLISEQAENLLHTQKFIMLLLLERKWIKKTKIQKS